MPSPLRFHCRTATMAAMDKPIGVFDSGIGGLTVVKEIVRVLPNESLVFLGDTARVPYGNRGPAVVEQFAHELVACLLARDVKYLVAACNTISSTCLDAISAMSPVPVLGVVAPAAGEAVKQTRRGRIGVIGTRATIASRFYEQQIQSLDPGIEVFSQACPLFVPFAEEGMIDSEPTRLVARDYLADLACRGIDVLILGCTHYPILREVIQQVMGESVLLVDSARPTAEELSSSLRQLNLVANGRTPDYELLVTDAPERVGQVAATFFGGALPGPLSAVTLG